MPPDLVKPARIALLQGPPQAERDRLDALARTEANHAEALAGLACLQRVEAPAAERQEILSFPLTVAAWNLERCYNVEKSAAVLQREGTELVLLPKSTTAWHGPLSGIPRAISQSSSA